MCIAGSATGVPQNRGLQLGEENAPLVGLPGSWQSKRRVHRIHDVTKQQVEVFPNSGSHLVDKCLNDSRKLASLLFAMPFLNDLLGGAFRRGKYQLFRYFRTIAGWQRQELVILVSALAHSLRNFSFATAASLAFFCCAFRLLASPKSDQPFSGKRARSTRYTCSASA